MCRCAKVCVGVNVCVCKCMCRHSAIHRKLPSQNDRQLSEFSGTIIVGLLVAVYILQYYLTYYKPLFSINAEEVQDSLSIVYFTLDFFPL